MGHIVRLISYDIGSMVPEELRGEVMACILEHDDIENAKLMVDWSLAMVSEVGIARWPGFDRDHLKWFVAAFVIVSKLVGPEAPEIHPLDIASMFKIDISWGDLKRMEAMLFRIIDFDPYKIKTRWLGCTLI
jgi:hypothetical protein